MKIRRLATVLAVLAGFALTRAFAAEDVNVKADVTVGKKAGTTESVTVVQPGPGGETTVLSKEVVTEEKAKTPRKEVAEDTTPRKARVAVMPAIFAQHVRSKFERELKEKFGLSDVSIIENPGYTSYLVDALVNTRKLDIMERENLRSVIKEIDFGESDYADMVKVVKIGQMLNADYVVLPEIIQLGLLEYVKEVPYIGPTTDKRYKGVLTTLTRVVDVKTSKIAASNRGDTEVKYRPRKVQESPREPAVDLVIQLYTETGLKEAASIVDTAYPIKIVAVAKDTCVLNRGEGAIKEGEILNVYAPGEVMVDPDTKENLGYHEARVGKIKVVKVDEKTCTAEIVEGADKITKLCICRRDVKAEPAGEAPAPKLD